MTKTLNQIIFFFLHQNQNIFFSNIGNQNIFLEKTITPPHTHFKLNGRSLTKRIIEFNGVWSMYYQWIIRVTTLTLRDQVTFRCDDNDDRLERTKRFTISWIYIVLIHAGKHVTALGFTISIPSQTVFALTA